MMKRSTRAVAALATGALLATASVTSVAAQDEKPYEGVTLNVITFTGPRCAPA